MKTRKILISLTILLMILSSTAYTLPPVGGETFGIVPISNEVSFYRNVDDAGNDRGRTLQIVAINGFNLWTNFVFEFTADINYDMSNYCQDHYIELSLVKPVWKYFSVNYQRIFSKFEEKPINQFGLRLSF
jgi:hypothetical protein